MKKIIPAAFFLILSASCAVFQAVPDYLQPLHVRLVSSESLIREAAAGEYAALDENGKKGVIMNMIGQFEKEEDPYKRLRMLDFFAEFRGRAGIIVPLIMAARNNPSIRDYKEIISFLSSHKPREGDLEQLVELVKNGSWEARMLAMTSLSMLSKNAGKAVPELMQMLNEFGGDAGKYQEIFDAIARINPEIAVAAVIRDLKNPESSIRKNSLLKLFELQEYLGKKLPAKKEIMPALIRALYSGDEAISKIAEDGLSRIDDPDARQAVGNYMKMGRRAIDMLFKFAGRAADEVFRMQEEGIEKKINEYYRSVGREDAVK